MKKLRVALVGMGVRMKDHEDVIAKMDDVEVAAFAEIREDRRAEAAARWPEARVYNSYAELIDAESLDTIDAIMISVEPTAHGDCELKIVEKGIPFFIEKPLNIDIETAEKVLVEVEKKGLITSVGFQDRYLNVMEIIKEELPKHKSGGLVYGAWVGGTPKAWWWQKKSTCAGQLVEQSIHLLDGLRWLYGEPLSVYAVANQGMQIPGVDASEEYDTDDHSTVVLRFPGHVTATLVSGCYVKVKPEGYSLRPRCGFEISLDDMVLDYRLRKNLIITTREEIRDIQAHDGENTLRCDRAFFDAVMTGDKSLIRSPYSDGMKTLRLGFAANKSMETGEVIYFNK